MGRIGRMGRMIMGRGDERTILWGTMGQWDSTPCPAELPRTTHYALRTTVYFILKTLLASLAPL